MTAENLGRMFAPSIIRHETDTMDLQAAQMEACLVSYLISHVYSFSSKKSKTNQSHRLSSLSSETEGFNFNSKMLQANILSEL